MKPVIDVLESNRTYGVDTDAFNPDGVLVVETNEELARIPNDRRTPNLLVKVNSTTKYYKVDPENIEKFIETTPEEVKSLLDSTYSKAEIDAKLADVSEKIEEVKSSGNSLTKEVADSVYATKVELNELSGRLDNIGSNNADTNVNLADSAEFIALNNKVTTLEGEVGRLRTALDAKADVASIPSLATLEGEVAALKAALDTKADIDTLPDVQEYANTILTALSTGPGLDILTKNILASIEKANSDKTPSGDKSPVDVSTLATKAELGDKLDTTQFESEKATFATKDELANKVDKSDLTQIDLTQIKALLKAEIIAELQQQAQQTPGAESGVS